jgi:hypothetical protein
MGLLLSKLLHKLGLLSDEDLAEKMLENAADDVHQAASIAKRMSPYRSDPDYTEQVKQANRNFANATGRAREILNSLKPNVLLSVKARRRTMKKGRPRSPHRNMSQTQKRNQHV